MANRPEPEIDITRELVSALLDDQFPELAERELHELSRGWDNTNWKLGDDAIIRIPHREVAAQLIRHEQAWLPLLQQHISVAIPAPTHAGEPTEFYPWAWSVTPFFDGVEAASTADIDQPQAALTLARFFHDVHVPAPANAPTNHFRGCALADRSDSFAANLARLSDDIDTEAMHAVFDHACSLEATTEHVWLHGDLHTRNMVVHNGDLAAVIDWGDICAGDRATDLAGAFMLVPDHVELVKQHAGANDAAWQRARGWAANFAAVYLAHSDDDAVMALVGQRLLAALGIEARDSDVQIDLR